MNYEEAGLRIIIVPNCPLLLHNPSDSKTFCLSTVSVSARGFRPAIVSVVKRCGGRPLVVGSGMFAASAVRTHPLNSGKPPPARMRLLYVVCTYRHAQICSVVRSICIGRHPTSSLSHRPHSSHRSYERVRPLPQYVSILLVCLTQMSGMACSLLARRVVCYCTPYGTSQSVPGAQSTVASTPGSWPRSGPVELLQWQPLHRF